MISFAGLGGEMDDHDLLIRLNERNQELFRRLYGKGDGDMGDVPKLLEGLHNHDRRILRLEILLPVVAGLTAAGGTALKLLGIL